MHKRIMTLKEVMDAEQPRASADCAPTRGSAAAWRALAMRLADEATVVLDNAHWEVNFGSGDLRATIKAVQKKYRLETRMGKTT